MKLAEALQERADCSRRIDQLEARIQQSALVQEGEEPPEDPQALMEEMDAAISRLGDLMRQINLTNSATLLDGEPLTALIARRDALQLRVHKLQNICNAAGNRISRARGTEIRILPTLDVAALRKETDRLARELRLLDNRLQQCNWTCDLME